MDFYPPPVVLYRTGYAPLPPTPIEEIDPRLNNRFVDTKWRAVVPPQSDSHPTHHLRDVPLPPPVGSRAKADDLRSSFRSFDSGVQMGELERILGVDYKAPLDRYAPTFTPSWLKTLPPPEFTAKVPPAQPFPRPDYNPLPKSPLIEVKDIPIKDIYPSILAPGFPSLPPVILNSTKARDDPMYYTGHFSSLLALHLEEQLYELDRSIIYNIPLPIPTTASNVFRISISGIKEDAPKLSIGDRMMFRGLYLDLSTASRAQVEGEVVGLIKSKGWVFVFCPDLAQLDSSLPRVKKPIEAKEEDEESSRDEIAPAAAYQIRFLVNASSVCTMQDAVRAMGWALKEGHKIAKDWLFPETGSYPQGFTLPQQIYWVDGALNKEQKGAITAIVSARHSIPFLISGPPGTGKTKTLVEAVHHILASNRHAAILLCAPSNPAADTLTRRLAKILSPSDMFRLNAPNRTFAEVGDDVLPYCHVEGQAFGLPKPEALLNYRVVVSTCLDADILNKANLNNWSTMGMEAELRRKLHPRLFEEDRVLPHWTHLIIDEAAQASEPETLVPISVVLPYAIGNGTSLSDVTIVLCGDSHQLGPIISSREARDGGLDTSLLERLFDREVYSNHPSSRKHLKVSSNGHSTLAPFANLVQNYRSIAPILMVPAALFYDDTLVASANDVELIKWSKLPNPQIPILFAGTETDEDWIDEGASWFNEGEIVKTVDMVRSILGEQPHIQQKEIAVITPWREQVWRMRAALRKAGYGAVDVGNVEAYQGAEFRVTILSCVRSRARFLESDRISNMGLFDEPKRFNVAITRAKELLVIIGNADLLQRDPFWNGFLQIAMRNNLYVGPSLCMPKSEAYLTSIEEKLRREAGVDDADHAMFLAGSMARHTLKD